MLNPKQAASSEGLTVDDLYRAYQTRRGQQVFVPVDDVIEAYRNLFAETDAPTLAQIKQLQKANPRTIQFDRKRGVKGLVMKVNR